MTAVKPKFSGRSFLFINEDQIPDHEEPEPYESGEIVPNYPADNLLSLVGALGPDIEQTYTLAVDIESQELALHLAEARARYLGHLTHKLGIAETIFVYEFNGRRHPTQYQNIPR